MSDYCVKKPRNYYGKIDYLYSEGIGETLYYKNKKAFEKEIHDSNEIGRPINAVYQYEIEQGR